MNLLRTMSRSELFIMLAGLIYVLSPVDIIPEIVAGPLGLADDATAVAVMFATVLAARNRVKEQPVGIRGS